MQRSPRGPLLNFPSLSLSPLSLSLICTMTTQLLSKKALRLTLTFKHSLGQYQPLAVTANLSNEFVLIV